MIEGKLFFTSEGKAAEIIQPQGGVATQARDLPNPQLGRKRIGSTETITTLKKKDQQAQPQDETHERRHASWLLTSTLACTEVHAIMAATAIPTFILFVFGFAISTGCAFFMRVLFYETM